MPRPIVLASSSDIRARLMRSAGLDIRVQPARVDEDSVKAALMAEGATPRDLADTLAEMKARKIAERMPDDLVLGCDQVLALGRQVFSKPGTPAEAADQLRALRGQSHHLLSAIVLYDRGEPVWRHVGTVRLTMRDFSEDWLAAYIDRNWESIRHSVGGYKLEEEGIRLFTCIEGDYFTVLGLPLLPLLAYLGQRGFIET